MNAGLFISAFPHIGELFYLRAIAGHFRSAGPFHTHSLTYRINSPLLIEDWE